MVKYAVFVSFFPQLGSGPIERGRNILSQLDRLCVNSLWDYDRIKNGILLLLWGLFQKIVIADRLALYVDTVFGSYQEYGLLVLTTAMVLYAFQIYCDFDGYTNIACGAAQVMGITLMQNFKRPYFAVNIKDFWSRWHISLTSWFRDYLYIPLGGNRKGTLRKQINVLIVFCVSGLWHGASWTFILWGTLHGSFMILTKHFKKYVDKVPKIVSRIITLLFVNFCWILFRANSMENFRQMMKSIFQGNWGMLHEDLCGFFEISVLKYFPGLTLPYWLCAVTILIAGFWITLSCKNVQEKAENLKYSVASCIWTAIVVVFSILSLSGVSTYIYAYF